MATTMFAGTQCAVPLGTHVYTSTITDGSEAGGEKMVRPLPSEINWPPSGSPYPQTEHGTSYGPDYATLGVGQGQYGGYAAVPVSVVRPLLLLCRRSP